MDSTVNEKIFGVRKTHKNTNQDMFLIVIC